MWQKTKKWRARVWLMFLLHFDELCDLLPNRPTATWILFVLYKDSEKKKDRYTNLPLTAWLAVRGFVLVQAFFKSQTLLFFSASSFVLYLTCVQFLRNVFQCRVLFFFLHKLSRIMAKTFCKTASLSFMTHDGNFCEDFLWPRHSQEVKSTFCLHFFIFLLCK